LSECETRIETNESLANNCFLVPGGLDTMLAKNARIYSTTEIGCKIPSSLETEWQHTGAYARLATQD